MKKILKSFTFWCVLIAIFEIYMHQSGQDSYSLILIALNPILYWMCESKPIQLIMNSGIEIPCNTVAGSISVYWYIGSLITFMLYGGIIDFIRYKVKKTK